MVTGGRRNLLRTRYPTLTTAVNPEGIAEILRAAEAQEPLLDQ